MRRSEFDLLHPYDKEDFLNNDGIVENDDFPVAPVPDLVHSLSETVKDSVLPTVELGKETPPVTSVNQEESSPSYSLGFDIQDPFELLLMLDENVQKGASNGGVDLHQWQIQIMLDFASSGKSDKEPFQAIVRACNGSGKDKYVIAPCVVWLSMKYCKTISVVTSASGAQLDNQTCRYIKQLCDAVNTKFNHNIWNTKYRHYTCDFGDGLGDKSPKKSEIFCYATDEPGKAEGYHPTDFGCKMGIFVSEDKTVPDEINIALNKCTGYTHRMHVSTPGLQMGHFYDYDNTAIPREEITDLRALKPIDWIKYLVTAYKCSHISSNYIEQMKRDLPGGENGSAFRSQILAEFGTTDEETVIPYIHIWALNKNKPAYRAETHNHAGLDLSRGGDETVLSVRNGNKLIAMIPFRFDNNVDTKEFLISKFKEYELTAPEAAIWTDAGGLGVGIIDELRAAGWYNVKYVNNQGKPRDGRVYKNKGAEMWWHLAKLIERKLVILVDDFVLTNQLATRYYKRVSGQLHQLESKHDAKMKGHPSPDRADSVVLCFSDYAIENEEIVEEWKAPYEYKREVKAIPDLTIREGVKRKNDTDGLPRTPKISSDSFNELKDEYNEYIRRRKQLTN